MKYFQNKMRKLRHLMYDINYIMREIHIENAIEIVPLRVKVFEKKC